MLRPGVPVNGNILCLHVQIKLPLSTSFAFLGGVRICICKKNDTVICSNNLYLLECCTKHMEDVCGNGRDRKITLTSPDKKACWDTEVLKAFF